ncbi:MAG TPA: NAD-dependent epimerase/dehydratase, partial [Nitrospiraceae bacterium]
EVHAVARQPLTVSIAAPVQWHQVDLLDATALPQVLRTVSPTHLLHLAWVATPGVFWNSPENTQWVEASVQLLREFAAQRGRRIVMAGTCAEFDWSALQGPCGDHTPCRPNSLYGASKNALRLALHAYARQYGLSAAWGRIFLLYGPHEHPKRLVPSVIRGLLRREEVACTHGAQQRDFMHVQDAAHAFVALLESDVQGDMSIGTGAGVPVRDVVTHVAQSMHGLDLIELGSLPTPAHEPPYLVADVTRQRVEVGFTPRWGLADGLADTIAWWRSELAEDVGAVKDEGGKHLAALNHA